MDPFSWELFGQALFDAITLFVLLAGLVGLLVPIFPGLTIMWIGTLIYAIIQAANENMTWVDWTLFGFITLLMIGGNIIDNIIIAKHVREKDVPWSSILLAFAAGIIVSLIFTPLGGMVAAPAGLFLAEWRRLKDRNNAFANTKAWMTGFGWAIAAKMGIGVVMILLWMLWAWV
ncbi:MAG: DUF456 domain-containing protein [Anaerolineales bacterium]|jgi:hypothetical protein|nr:DUF456 domain-containing protein [Anaerolineales bacterium]